MRKRRQQRGLERDAPTEREARLLFLGQLWLCKKKCKTNLIKAHNVKVSQKNIDKLFLYYFSIKLVYLVDPKEVKKCLNDNGNFAI